MRKIIILLVGLHITYVITGTDVAYSISVAKPIYSIELLKYVKGSEFVKLSFKQFTVLTCGKENLRNRISFSLMKMKVKHDLKKNPKLTLSEYDTSKYKMSTVMKILAWVIGILLILLLVVALIYSGQRR